MKKFGIKLSLFLLPVILFFVVAGFLADGKTDDYYLKFASEKQQSLIIGTSKAFQGLQPQIFDNTLQDNYTDLKVFNFAFTLLHSPYGEVYYKAIKEKLNENSVNGLFILTVDPWALSVMKSPKDTTTFLEATTFLNEIRQFNGSPNFEYLIKSYTRPWTDIYWNKVNNQNRKMLLHENGWLEVTLPMDSTLVAKRTEIKIEKYRTTNLVEYNASEIRMHYFEKTIQLLKQHGDVYIVRLPTHEKIIKMENQLIPEFDSKMEKLSQLYNTRYFSFADSASKYVYTDGVHLHKSSGAVVSRQLARLIKEDKSVFLNNRLAAK